MLFKSLLLCQGNDIWFDELFSVALPQHSYGQLLQLAAKDVHPPLYYLILKLAIDCSSMGRDYVVVIAKFMSLVPFFILGVYSLTIIRKYFGAFTAGFFYFAVIAMPQMPAFLLEIRMYSFAMFFVTAAFLHGYLILYWRDNLKKRRLHFVCFFLYGMASAYTHYFGCIAIFAVYLMVLLGILLQERKLLVGWVFSAIASVIGFLPWLSVLIKQMSAVKESYWIPPVSLRTFGGCVKYLLWPNFENQIVNYLASFCFLIIIVGAFTGVVWKWKAANGSLALMQKASIGGCAVLVVLVILGVGISVLLRPIFVYRYMYPALGCFWLGIGIAFSTGFAKMEKKNNGSVICAIIVCMIGSFILSIGIRQFNLFRWEEEKKLRELPHTMETLRMIDEDSAVICNFNQVQAILWNYLPNDSFLWGWTEETLIAQICNRDEITMISEAADLKELLARYENVYYVGTGNVREDIITDWQAEGLKVDLLVDSCLLERYWFNLYLISE